MKHTKQWLAILLGILTIAVIPGCGTLDKEGAYKGDKILYNADKMIVSSYEVLHAFVKWEYQNRASVSKDVTKAADAVRANARKWISSASALREAYAGNPNDQNRTALVKSLDVLESAIAETMRYMYENQVKAPGTSP